MKRDYTKAIVWTALGVATVTVWAIIYTLLF